MSNQRGLFVTFEGVEGSGKSCQAITLEDRLAGLGVRVVLTREPGGTKLGESVRQILLDPEQAGMLPLSELLLYEASRAEHVEHVIRPLLEEGAVVISDRYADASVAYQGGGRELGTELVELLNDVATDGLRPDITFLLDLDPSLGLSRQQAGGKSSDGVVGPDRIERENLEFHERVRTAYLEIAEREPSRYVVLDGRLSKDELSSLVVEKVLALLAHRSGTKSADSKEG